MIYKTIPISVSEHTLAKLFLYIIDNSVELKPDRQRPIVIICPGGGYCMTSDREAEPVALQYLAMGYHAAILRYSVKPAKYPAALLELGNTVKYLKEHGELSNDTIVTTIMSNIGLYKALDKLGIKYEKTAVGDKYVNENMVKNGHCIGGEQSGHIIFSKHATTGDGILTSLKIMEAMIESKRTLAQLVEPVKIYPQLMKNVYVRDKKEAQSDPAVQEVIKEVEAQLGDEGRVLVRESGTEPVVRVMVEANTNEMCLQSVDKIISKMKERGFIIER